MVIDVKADDFPKGYYGAKVFDAGGNRIRHVVRCDTGTGEVTRYLPLDDNPDKHDGPAVTDRHPAPLRVERMERVAG